jgi:hypothetical protein
MRYRLRAASVETMVDPVGWRLEMANFPGTYPTAIPSSSSSMARIALVFRLPACRRPPVWLGYDLLDLGLAIIGPWPGCGRSL